MCKNTMGKCLFHRSGGPTSSECNPFAPSLDQLALGDLEAVLVAFARGLTDDRPYSARDAGRALLVLLEESGVDVNPRTEE